MTNLDIMVFLVIPAGMIGLALLVLWAQRRATRRFDERWAQSVIPRSTVDIPPPPRPTLSPDKEYEIASIAKPLNWDVLVQLVRMNAKVDAFTVPWINKSVCEGVRHCVKLGALPGTYWVAVTGDPDVMVNIRVGAESYQKPPSEHKGAKSA